MPVEPGGGGHAGERGLREELDARSSCVRSSSQSGASRSNGPVDVEARDPESAQVDDVGLDAWRSSGRGTARGGRRPSRPAACASRITSGSRRSSGEPQPHHEMTTSWTPAAAISRICARDDPSGSSSSTAPRRRVVAATRRRPVGRARLRPSAPSRRPAPGFRTTGSRRSRPSGQPAPRPERPAGRGQPQSGDVVSRAGELREHHRIPFGSSEGGGASLVRGRQSEPSSRLWRQLAKIPADSEEPARAGPSAASARSRAGRGRSPSSPPTPARRAARCAARARPAPASGRARSPRRRSGQRVPTAFLSPLIPTSHGRGTQVF